MTAINSFSELSTGVLLPMQCLVGATALLLLAGVVAVLLRRQSAALRHRVWTLAMAGLLALPVLAMLLPNWGPQWREATPGVDSGTTVVLAEADVAVVRTQPAAAVAASLPFDGSSVPSRTRRNVGESSSRPSQRREPVAAELTSVAASESRGDESTRTVASPPRGATAVSSADVGITRVLCSGLFGFWLAGVIVGLLALLRSQLSAFQITGRAVPVSDCAVVALNEELHSAAGVDAAVGLLCSSEISVPLTCGCVRPVILLPAGYGRWTAERLRVVLAHEMAHIARRDVWWQLIARLACCLYWCHPLVWLANWRMRIEREFACDDAVLAMGEVPGRYATHLVDVAAALRDRSRPPLAAVAMASRSTLEGRVRAILHPCLRRTPVTRRMGRLLIAGTLAVVAALSLLSPSKNQQADAGPQAENATAADSADKAATNAAKAQPDQSSAAATPPTVLEDGHVLTTGSMRIHVLDPDGEPFPGVNIYADRRNYTTDPDGVAEIEIPKRLSLLRVWIRKKSYVPLFLQWWPGRQPDGHLIPEEYTVQLPKGTEIGGVVQNEDREPIEGVTLEVRHDSGKGEKAEMNTRPRLGTSLADRDEDPHGALTTDAQGRWSLDNVPAGNDREIRVKLSHPDYIEDENWGGLQREQLITLDSLRDQTAVIVMKRGISVTGRVTDLDGTPVEDAVLVWGEGYWRTVDRETFTDDQGVFTFPPLPSGPTGVTVFAKGWKPVQREINIQPKMPPIDFALQPGRLLRIRFVNRSGNPVPQVLVYLEKWQRLKSLGDNKGSIYRRMPRLSNQDGHYRWSWAPEEPVTYRLRTEGYANLDVTLTADGTEHVVTLDPIMNVSGSVTDARTGEYVDTLQAMPVIYFRPDFLSVNRGDAVDGRKGRFEIEFERTDIEHGVRIEAEGYRTQIVGPWTIGDPNPALQINLEPAAPINGTVIDAAGRPVADAKVYLGTHTQHLDIRNHEDTDEDTFLRKTDADGRFTFPAQYEPYALIVIHESGYADVLHSPDEQPGGLTLRPWAQVGGRLLHNGKPIAGQHVRLDAIRPRSYPLPRIDESFWVTTDKEGRYAFERVPPVKCALSAYLSVWDEFPFNSSQSVPLDLQPGDDLTIDLNGEGAEVTGRVVLSGETRGEIDLNYSLNYLLALREGIAPPPTLAEKGFDWQNGWSDAWTSSEEGQSYKDTLHHYFVKLNRDGRFHISGVPPGEYELALKIYEPPEHGCLVQPVATRHVRFEVTTADVESGRDLGAIGAHAFLGPQPGEPAPDFTFESLDGSTQSLSELRGQYVLIDVWATWCAPCVAKLPAIREIHNEFAGDDRVVVLSVNLDRDIGNAKEFVKVQNLPWQHGFLGDWSHTDFPVHYGISSMPAYLLIGPDGRLVHKGYQADELRRLLSETLSPASP